MEPQDDHDYAVVRGPYRQRSVRARIEAFFLDNLGKVATREQIIEVATDPNTGRQPENWRRQPHSLNPNADPGDPSKWQPLCGRHQVMKKNYWDDDTGWLNVTAIVQAASESDKRRVYRFLKTYFGDS